MSVTPPTIIQKPAHPNNYTIGRSGGRDGQYTFHHIVGSADSAVAVFQNPSRQASCTYIVTNIPGVIYQVVDEANTSWADGNWSSNCRAITTEHHGDWRNGYRDENVINNAARLVAWLRDRGIITHFYRHRDLSTTACCCDLPCEEIWNKATQIINDSNTPIPPPVTSNLEWTQFPKVKTYVFNKPTKLWNFNQTSWAGFGNGVKDFNQGDKVDIYGQAYNKTLDAIYYVTEYSFTQRITNGFNMKDLDEYVPTPEPPKPEWQKNLKDIEPVKLMVLVEQTPVIDLNDLSIIKQLGQGTYIDFLKTTTVNGVEYLISSWSAEHGVGNGIPRSDVGVPVEEPNSEKPDWLATWTDIEDVDMYARCDTDLISLEGGETVKVIARGTKVRVVGTAEWFSHKVAVTDEKQGYAIRLDDLDLKPVEDGELEPSPEQPEIKPLSLIQIIINLIINLLKKIFRKE